MISVALMDDGIPVDTSDARMLDRSGLVADLRNRYFIATLKEQPRRSRVQQLSAECDQDWARELPCL